MVQTTEQRRDSAKRCDAERKRKPYTLSETQKEKQKATRLWVVYRLTLEDQKKILEFQGGVCAISGKPPKKQPLSCDHDHKNGKIRGMISTRINRGLAYFNDDPALLRRAADYLENPTAPRALGREVYGLIGQARHKSKMVYGSPSGPIKAMKKVRRKNVQ
jgi:Recombination endonuclease VII